MNNLVKMLVVIAIVIGVIAGVYYFSEQEKREAASAQTKVGFVLDLLETMAGPINIIRALRPSRRPLVTRLKLLTSRMYLRVRMPLVSFSNWLAQGMTLFSPRRSAS